MTRAILLCALMASALWVAPAPLLAAPAAPQAAAATASAEPSGPPNIKPPPKSARDMPPAKGHAYFYRQILLALVIVALVIAFLVWLVRRETRETRSTDRA